jgi:Sec-independent protein translocase protein TatA
VFCFIVVVVVVVVVVGMMRLLEVNRRIEVAVSYFLIFIFSTLFE